MRKHSHHPAADLDDAFPQTPARAAVVAVVRAYGLVQRLMGPYFARFGLTPPQFQLLTVLNRHQDQPVTQRRLAGELYVSFPNITVMLARLEQAGLIQRQANTADRREKFVALTRQGRALLRKIWKEHQQQLDSVVAGLTNDEQLQLARLANKLLDGHATTDGSAEPARERQDE